MRFLRPCLVKVPHIRLKDTLKLLLLQDQQLVQAFLSDAPQEALADGIGAFRMNRRFEDLDRARFRHTSKARSKLAVVLTNQVLGCEPLRGRFSQVLRYPGISRRTRDAHVHHLP
jgi:hypothetical protein